MPADLPSTILFYCKGELSTQNHPLALFISLTDGASRLLDQTNIKVKRRQTSRRHELRFNDNNNPIIIDQHKFVGASSTLCMPTTAGTAAAAPALGR